MKKRQQLIIPTLTSDNNTEGNLNTEFTAKKLVKNSTLKPNAKGVV